MFAKIFTQIFDSTIAENYRHRHVFMDLLVMADIDGVVNKTVEAVARTANAPVEEVRSAIEFLSRPDAESQNKEHDGRRLIPIEDGRDWGWRIVSYHHYRAIRDEEQRRQYHRDYYLERKKKKEAKRSKKAKYPDGHSGKPLLSEHSPRLDPDRWGPQEGPPE